ncbi:MAG: hypothetical protein R3F60_33400 [bacterium]
MLTAKAKKKLAGAMYGVEFSSEFPSPWAEKRPQNYGRYAQPPSYMVEAVIRQLDGGRVFTGGDKSAWQTGLSFDGHLWCIEDWRRRSWNLWGPPDQEVSAAKLVKKLSAASRIVDGQIFEAGRELASGPTRPPKQHHRVRNLYEFFRGHAETTLANIDDFHTNRKLGGLEGLAAFLNARISLDRELEAHTLSAVMFLLRHDRGYAGYCFALGDRGGQTFFEYRKLDWSERFSRFFDTGRGDCQAVYDEVLQVRREHRNVWAHADPVLFVPVEDVGLVPMSYDDLDKPRMNFFTTIDAAEASRIFAAFDRLIGLFDDHDLGWYAREYASSGLPILMAEDQARKLRDLMNDRPPSHTSWRSDAATRTPSKTWRSELHRDPHNPTRTARPSP